MIWICLRKQAHLLDSRLKGWNLLHQHTDIHFFLNRQNELKEFVSQENVWYFVILFALLLRCIFIDSSKVNLKVVPLHNRNKFPSVPLAHATNTRLCENTKLLFEKIKYGKYNWNICGDLKVTAVLLSLQLGYTKFCCFLCGWDSRDKKHHYIQKQ